MIYRRSSLKSAHFVMIHYQTWPYTGNSCFWWAKLTEAWQEASMECPLWRLLISSRSVNKHVPRAILVSDWSISKKSSPLKLPSQMNRNLVGSIYMYMEGCVLSFLKTEWKVSDTGSAHWGSNFSSSEMYVSYLRQVGSFLQVLWFPPAIKLTTTILLKYCWKLCALNTITQPPLKKIVQNMTGLILYNKIESVFWQTN